MKVLAVVVALVLTSATASAATVEQIVALSKAGVSDSVILALIDRDKTIFTLDADQLVTLKRQGVSEAIVLAMLKSGRAEADAAVRAESEMRAAGYAASIQAGSGPTQPGPDVVVVGHGPDVPNTSPYATPGGYGWTGAAQGVVPGPYAYPYVVPYGGYTGPIVEGPVGGPHVGPPSPPLAIDERAPCVAPARVGSSVTSRGVGFATVCADGALLHKRVR
jgi:hypothetical protein